MHFLARSIGEYMHVLSSKYRGIYAWYWLESLRNICMISARRAKQHRRVRSTEQYFHDIDLKHRWIYAWYWLGAL